MAEFDLVIRGGTVVTASDRTACDVGIKDGKVVQLGVGLKDFAPGQSVQQRGLAAGDRTKRHDL